MRRIERKTKREEHDINKSKMKGPEYLERETTRRGHMDKI